MCTLEEHVFCYSWMECPSYVFEVHFVYSVYLILCFLVHLMFGFSAIIERIVLKFPNIIVLLSVFPFSSVCICFIYLCVLVLGIYVLLIITASWLFDPFIII